MLSTSQTLFKYIQFLTLIESYMEVELSVTKDDQQGEYRSNLGY